MTLEEVICESKQSYGAHLAAESVAPEISSRPEPQSLISRSKYHSAHLRCSRLHISPAQKIAATKYLAAVISFESIATEWFIFKKLTDLSNQRLSANSNYLYPYGGEYYYQQELKASYFLWCHEVRPQFSLLLSSYYLNWQIRTQSRRSSMITWSLITDSTHCLR